MRPVVRRGGIDDLAGLVTSTAALFIDDAGQHDSTMNLVWPYQDGGRALPESIQDPERLVLIADDGGTVVAHGSPFLLSCDKVATAKSRQQLYGRADDGPGSRAYWRPRRD